MLLSPTFFSYLFIIMCVLYVLSISNLLSFSSSYSSLSPLILSYVLSSSYFTLTNCFYFKLESEFSGVLTVPTLPAVSQESLDSLQGYLAALVNHPSIKTSASLRKFVDLQEEKETKAGSPSTLLASSLSPH